MSEVSDSTGKALSSKDTQLTQMQTWLDESKARHSELITELEAAKSRIVNLESDLRSSKEALHSTHESMVLKVGILGILKIY